MLRHRLNRLRPTRVISVTAISTNKATAHRAGKSVCNYTHRAITADIIIRGGIRRGIALVTIAADIITPAITASAILSVVVIMQRRTPA
jgi:hypothetical protein